MKYILILCVSVLFLNKIQAQDTEIQEIKKQADSLFLYGNYQESLTHYQSILEKYKNQAKPNKIIETKLEIVKILIRSGNFDEAEKIVTQIKNPENELLKADLWTQNGLVELHKGRNDKAQKFLTNASQIYTKNLPENHPKIAEIYNHLGVIFWNSGRIKNALDFHHKSLYIKKKIYGEMHPETAGSYNNIGLTYGLTQEALNYYEKALKIYKNIYSENHPTTANVYINLALIYRQNKNYEFALFNFEKSLEIGKTLHQNKQHPNEAFILSNIGQVYLDEKKYDKALEKQIEALKIYKNSYGKKHPEIAGIYNLIGSIYASQQLYKQALMNYQNALSANVSDFDSEDILQNPTRQNYYKAEILLNTLHLKARAWEGLHYSKTLRFKDLENAVWLLDDCDKFANHIRQTRTHQQDKIALGSMMSEVYEDAIRISAALAGYSARPKKWHEKAFYFAERSKASVLLSSVAESNAKAFAGIPENILQTEQNLKSEIALLEQKLAEKKYPEHESRWRNQLIGLTERYDQFIQKMERDFPKYYDLKYNPYQIQLTDLQKNITENMMLISYFSGERRIYIFRVTKDDVQVLDVPKIENFDKKIRGLRNAIFYKSKRKLIESSSLLYTQLFPKKLPRHIEKLIIIPDGQLGTIPFEVLLTENLEKIQNTNYSKLPFLVKKCAISYLYSASLLQANTTSNQTKTDGILLCAPVNFTYSQSDSYEQIILNKLPDTESEVLGLEKLFSKAGMRTESRLYESANENFIKSDKLEKYKYIHWATHGMVNESTPELSRIFLAESQQQDGYLFSGELYNLKIGADLVTLSACQTGLGKVKKGEGIIGLSRALLYAGAKNLTVSLWKVSDTSTAKLMQDFYQNFIKNQNQNYTNALRDAKLQMLDNEVFAAPYYWASFILIGQ